MKKSISWLLCLLSASLLILAFPKSDIGIFAWIAFIPLMFTLDGKKPWAAFRSAYFCGFFFFLGTLYWFFNIARWFSWIAVLGVLLLLLYLALYFGFFGFFYSLFSRRKLLTKLLLLPSAWVVLEFTRAHLFTGFDWASLGHSQYKNSAVIQIADITGVFGVSFAIVMVNVLLKEAAAAFLMRKTSISRHVLMVPAGVTAAITAGILVYGLFRLAPADQPPAGQAFSAAIIQADISQEMKWDKASGAAIVDKHIALSEQALKHGPGLIIWPETSCPDYLWEERELFNRIQSFVKRVQTPLIFGSVLMEGDDFYNAALLLSPSGDVVDIYRKMHLVPFGEFIPLRRFLPFISDLLGIGDFTRGREHTVFPVTGRGGDAAPVSVLICFEDTVAGLSRQFVKNGARSLVNITNDAWFGDTKAPFMHLQSSAFRTVENRRELIRAANTGVSCAIDRWGRVKEASEGTIGVTGQETYVSGYAIVRMDFNDEETFYTKFGDVFAIFCFGCILMGIAVGKNNY